MYIHHAVVETALNLKSKDLDLTCPIWPSASPLFFLGLSFLICKVNNPYPPLRRL